VTETTTYVADPERPHLGGSLPGGDPRSLHPVLWRYLLDNEEVTSFLDVGCGDGAAVRWFRENGCTEAHGIDGLAPPDPGPWFIEHDYSKGAFPPRRPETIYELVDLVWSCEFVEHVEERHAQNFMETFKFGRLVLFTHAAPGQQGWHHVNCRADDYWVGACAAVGLVLDAALTQRCRVLAGEGYFSGTGLAFRRV
jgi:hypothetical protein